MTLQDLHLIGTTCIFIASKYEEVFPLKLELICEKVSHNKFSKDDIKNKEIEILENLEFQIYGPNILKFLGIFSKQFIENNSEEKFPNCLFQKALSYFAKMVLYDYNLVSKLNCLELAAGIFYSSLKLIETLCGKFDFQKKVNFMMKLNLKISK